ncbi:imidazole glycerol phosphate synthase subunit HisF [Butyrivibrio sp. CB08]|uniref:AglZ/HisF2 family acetamidino modification protein n=1 Tax=Butyrivibrio sp. CB08 TaxID=2364879 RepID=UPI000EA90CE8|nr:AglZ/HisF2 family acetamidino modification protein [Butyrivibrio sp. CB08]RKM57892.1 imidazole glycerol phosphate synthase subunit HisF [Butyrivibrio sp. CB08]
MYTKPRVIPSLLIENGDLVKTERFKKRTYIGDPINAVKIFNEEEADELCLLDISVKKNDDINFSLLEDIATEAFMPLSYGGGIMDMDEVKKLFRIGFEKLIFNTALYEKPDLIREAVAFAGSQSIVASIDVRRDLFGKTVCYTDHGCKKIKSNIIDYLHQVENLGVGEILLQSIDNDGVMKGYDYSLIGNITSNTILPVICLGGAGNLSDMVKAVNECGAHAVAAGSMFVYYGERKAVLINYPTEQEQAEAGIF